MAQERIFKVSEMPQNRNRYFSELDSTLNRTPLHTLTPLRTRVLPDIVAKLHSKSTDDTEVTSLNFRTPVQRTRTAELNEKVSPILACLRMTPGVLKQKQKHLIDQHNEIRKRSDQLITGGGVSLWPNMQQMRLTQTEIVQLMCQTLALCCLSLGLLTHLHGEFFNSLQQFTTKLHSFCRDSHITEMIHEDNFNIQIIAWHHGMLNITNLIGSHYGLSVMLSSYQVYSVCYLIGLLTLLYYLLDNMWAKNKLSPARIRRWMCLLAVIGAWTCFMVYGLYLAHVLETQAVRCVQKFSSSLSTLVMGPINLSKYQNILLYWRSRILDAHADGLLQLLDTISVRDLVFYLQFYSVPIFTILLGPVITLYGACWTVYSSGQYHKD